MIDKGFNNRLEEIFGNLFDERVVEYLQYVIPISDKLDENNQDPIIIHLKSEGQEFIYFGIDHSREIGVSDSNKMEELFTNLLEKRGGDNIVLVLEFLNQLSAKETPDVGQKKILNLATRNNIEVFCPDVSSDAIAQVILESEKFTKSQIATWIFVNALWGISLAHEKNNSDQRINTLLDYLKKKFGVNSIENINQEIHKSTKLKLSVPLSVSELASNIPDKDILRRIQSPLQNYGILNKIGIEMNYVRDLFIAANLIRILLDKKSVFAVYGANHVTSQSPAFVKFFSKS